MIIPLKKKADKNTTGFNVKQISIDKQATIVGYLFKYIVRSLILAQLSEVQLLVIDLNWTRFELLPFVFILNTIFHIDIILAYK